MSALGGCYDNDGNSDDLVDTCTPGDNMTNVEGLFDSVALEAVLVIVWDVGTEQGAKLPASYFDEVLLSESTDADVSALISNISHSNTQEITVSFNDLTLYLQNANTLTFSLAFPDRRYYIDCTHSGMEDLYLLNVTLNFDVNGNYANAEFSQTILYGAI